MIYLHDVRLKVLPLPDYGICAVRDPSCGASLVDLRSGWLPCELGARAQAVVLRDGLARRGAVLHDRLAGA